MKKEIFYLFLRYFIIIFSSIGNLFLFYSLFTLPTIYLSYLGISLFAEVQISGTMLILSKYSVEIIPACVAGAAYFLLFALALAVPKISPLKRIEIILISFLALLLFNSLRIIFLVLIRESYLFEVAHIVVWHLISTLFVVLLWISLVKIFKIKGIPLISDLKRITKLK